MLIKILNNNEMIMKKAMFIIIIFFLYHRQILGHDGPVPVQKAPATRAQPHHPQVHQ